MDTPHKILMEFCKVRNEKSSYYPSYENESPITNRVNFITDFLLDNKIKFSLDIFNDESKRYYMVIDEQTNQPKLDSQRKPIYNFEVVNGKYVNIEVAFSQPNITESVMFIAHHDINNTNSDNCQDNSASVSNLLYLIKTLKDTYYVGERNVYIVFTDCEEFGGRGSVNLAKRIKEGVFGNVKYVVNLELTANGNQLWADKNEKGELMEKLLIACAESNTELNIFKTPFNDSWNLREVGISTLCIGTLPMTEIAVVKQQGYCNTWALCHKNNDRVEFADEKDMNDFINNILLKLI